MKHTRQVDKNCARYVLLRPFISKDTILDDTGEEEHTKSCNCKHLNIRQKIVQEKQDRQQYLTELPKSTEP